MGVKHRLLAMAVPGILFSGIITALPQDWTLTSAPITDWTSVASSADGSRLVAVVAGGGIYVSTNSGLVWNPTSAPQTNWSAVASAADGRRLIATTWGPAYLSTNFGASWTDAGAPYVGWNLVASSADGNTLAMGGLGSFGGWLYSSTNMGATWIAPLVNVNLYSAASSADGQKWVVVGYVGGHFGGGYRATSTNAGVTFVGTWESSRYWRSVACSVDGRKLIAGTLSGLYTSPDFGVTWIPTGTPISDWWTSVTSSADGTRLVAVGGGLINTSTNSGTNWTIAAAPNTNWSSIASSADGCKLVAVANGGGICTWQTTPTPVVSITPSSSGFLISWIVPSMPFVLQETADLKTTDWIDVTTQPILNLTNLHHEVNVPLSSTNRFYRLKSL